ncbi:MAG: hypothetical protein WCJ58_06165 [bacterium]
MEQTIVFDQKITKNTEDKKTIFDFVKKHKKVVVIGAAAVVVGVVGVVFKKIKATNTLNIEKVLALATDLADNSEKVFGGLTQSTLDGLAKETYRGMKTVIHGDSLEYIYKTASGKGINSALFKFDDAGKLLVYLGNGPSFAAKSPRFFCDKILELMRQIK